MVTRFVDGAVTMSGGAVRADLGAVARAGRALRRLHTTAAPFAIEFRLFDDDRRVQGAAGRQVARRCPTATTTVQAEAEPARAALMANPVPLAPCHCDPLCENFLDTGDTDVRDRLRVRRQQRPDVGPRRPVGRGRLRRRAGRRAARAPTSTATPPPTQSGADGDPQGDVRPVVDAVGRDPTRQRQPGRRLLGVRRRPLRALPER